MTQLDSGNPLTERIPGTDGSEVRSWSEGETLIIDGTEATLDAAKGRRLAWAEKVKKEGKVNWICPLCERHAALKSPFKTRKGCEGHIARSHGAEIDLLQIEKADPSRWSPERHVQSPKRTAADMMDPRQAALYERSKQVSEKSAARLREAQKDSSKTLKADTLINTTTGDARSKISRLDDNELKKLSLMAYSRGRRDLLKACRKACAQRNIQLMF